MKTIVLALCCGATAAVLAQQAPPGSDAQGEETRGLSEGGKRRGRWLFQDQIPSIRSGALPAMGTPAPAQPQGPSFLTSAITRTRIWRRELLPRTPPLCSLPLRSNAPWRRICGE